MPHIYRSNLSCPDYSSAFKHATPIGVGNVPNHVSLHDPEIFDTCGYATHDEAALLWHIAILNPGSWLEIGSHTGWTTAHLAGDRNTVIAIDPEFTHPSYNKTVNPEFFHARFWENVDNALGAERADRDIRTVGQKSQRVLKQPTSELSGPFNGAFIDGEHEPPFPVVDAMLVLPLLKQDAVVVFHDGLGSPVQAGILYLQDHGFSVRVYETPQYLTVCTRGNVSLPNHTPDSRVDWASYRRLCFNTSSDDLRKWYPMAADFLARDV